MSRVYSDFFGPDVTLAASLNASTGDTTVDLSSVPTAFINDVSSGISTSRPVPIRVGADVASMEIMLLTAYDSGNDTWTVQRAADDTSVKSHASGDVVAHIGGQRNEGPPRDTVESQIYKNSPRSYGDSFRSGPITDRWTVQQGSAQVLSSEVLELGSDTIITLDALDSYSGTSAKFGALLYGQGNVNTGILLGHIDTNNWFAVTTNGDSRIQIIENHNGTTSTLANTTGTSAAYKGGQPLRIQANINGAFGIYDRAFFGSSFESEFNKISISLEKKTYTGVGLVSLGGSAGFVENFHFQDKI